MLAAAARSSAAAKCVVEPEKYADFDPVDVVEVPWLFYHQTNLAEASNVRTLSKTKKESYDKVIVVTVKPDNMCQPYLLLHRADLYPVIPGLADLLDSRDAAIPAIGNQDRARIFKVNGQSTHYMAGVIQEVKLFAMLDSGKIINPIK